MFSHTMLRRFAAAVALSVAVAGSESVLRADDHDKAAAEGRGSSFQPGTTKYFTFSAEQRNPTTLSARGFVKMRQFSTNFGDFSLRGRVTCLRVTGNQAVIGLIILNGDGTAAGQAGNAFRLIVQDGEPTNDPDLFDNSGYETAPANCAAPVGTPGGTVLEDGNIAIGDRDRDRN